MSAEPSNGPDSPVPLCVDLDGTLIHSDLLFESFLLLLKRHPLYLLMCPWWLLKGRATLKAEIARRVQLNGAALPYVTSLLDWLKVQKAQGRPIWLVTASDQHLAQEVARHVGLFDGVMASDGHANLKGERKALHLVQRFGEKGFDYCGNHGADLAVWAHARAAIVVNARARLLAQARACTQVDQVFPPPRRFFRNVAKALRMHQWAKNILIFVPIAASHHLTDPRTLLNSLLAFAAFSLCASSVYLLNDMLDLEADRQHPRKSRRPFAAGTLPLSFGLLAAPTLMLIAVGFSLVLPLTFLGVLSTYYAVTLAYSFVLKRLVMIDVLTLAGLYAVRIVAGAEATGITLSFWLLLFAIFIFLSLAIVKRYAELHAAGQRGQLKASGRGYQVDDLALLQSLGTASGYISVLVLALYVNTPDISAQYSHPQYVWMLCPILLYWISRMWMRTHRGRMHDDPLVFALKDRISLLTGLAAAIVLWLAV